MDFRDSIRVIEGFPTEGISFKDITTLLKDKDILRKAFDGLRDLVDNEGEIDVVVGPEARGFMFGTVLAYQIGAGFVPVRKPGKLPAEVQAFTYELEYGKDTLEIHKDAILPGQKVVLIDDLLATGGTLLSTAKLVESLGGEVVNIITLIELTGLKGREKLTRYNPKSLVTYEF